jgi:hypothetical protein
LFSLFVPLTSLAQEYNYVHYDTKDGLAGSTVYDVCQDKDGFIWFATENGLSRYDGTRFTNFTVKDGLPDNEILSLFIDSKGRLWIGAFNKEICYYFKGKIFNKTNDSLIKKIHLEGFLSTVAEAKNGTIAFSDNKNIILLIPTQRSQEIVSTKIPGKVITILQDQINKLIYAGNEKSEVYKLEDKNFKFAFSYPPRYRYFTR